MARGGHRSPCRSHAGRLVLHSSPRDGKQMVREEEGATEKPQERPCCRPSEAGPAVPSVKDKPRLFPARGSGHIGCDCFSEQPRGSAAGSRPAGAGGGRSSSPTAPTALGPHP